MVGMNPATSIGSVELHSPFGVAFTVPTKRALAATQARESYLRRRLAASTNSTATPGVGSGLSSSVGQMGDCSTDAAALVKVGAAAKSLLDTGSASASQDLVINTISCQVVGSGHFFKAALSVNDAGSGDRKYFHVSFFYSFAGAVNNATVTATTAKLRRLANAGGARGAAAVAVDIDAHGRELQTVARRKSPSPQGPAASLEAMKRVLSMTRPQAASLGTAPSAVALDVTVIPPAAATKDASFSKTLTNNDALFDSFNAVGGLKTIVALATVGVIVVGSFLAALLLYVIYFIYTHREIFSHLKEHWAGLEVLLHPSTLKLHIPSLRDVGSSVAGALHLRGPSAPAPASPAPASAAPAALVAACEAGDAAAIARLLAATPALAAAQIGAGETLMHAVARTGSLAAAAALADAGAPADKPSAAGVTPLAIAARRGDAALVTFLLSKGARAAQSSPSTGLTPLHHAVLAKSAAAAAALVQGGANKEALDANGASPAALARKLAADDAGGAAQYADVARVL